MVSLIESSFGIILEAQKPYPVPKVYDVLIEVKRRWNSEANPYHLTKWINQFDCVTWPRTMPDEVHPFLPVDFELDDAKSHDSLSGIKTDESRDTHLVMTNDWRVMKPDFLKPTYGTEPWVIARIRYEDIQAVVKNHNLNLTHKSLKDESKKAAYEREHRLVFDNISKVITLALNSEVPCRITLRDGKIKVVEFNVGKIQHEGDEIHHGAVRGEAN